MQTTDMEKMMPDSKADMLSGFMDLMAKSKEAFENNQDGEVNPEKIKALLEDEAMASLQKIKKADNGGKEEITHQDPSIGLSKVENDLRKAEIV